MYRSLFVFSTFIFILAGCSAPSVQNYADQTPVVDLREFFEGEITAWGVVQNRSGEVINRFRADMHGSWEGNRGILDEEFFYSNGDTQTRQWQFVQQDDNRYTGTASDVIGEASIDQAGNAINLNYTLRVPVGDRTYDLNFDDWMWLVEDELIINHATMKKFGFRVGELIVVIQKQ
ncbi:MAG: DUF3833 domain-containing protein [Pseudomonadales bacterium]